MKYNIDEFYPTPRVLLDKITKDMQWYDIGSVLEPSAGKGDIVEYLREATKYKRGWGNDGITDIDCRDVIDSFEGERSYGEVMNNKKYYIFDSSAIMIEQKAS